MFFCKAQRRLKEACVVKQQPQEQPQEQPQKSHEQDILQKHLHIDRSIFASYGTHAVNFWASLGIFMRQGRRTQDVGRRNNKITATQLS